MCKIYESIHECWVLITSTVAINGSVKSAEIPRLARAQSMDVDEDAGLKDH